MLINGKAVESCSGEFFDVINPATGEFIHRLPGALKTMRQQLLKLHRQLLAAGLPYLLSKGPAFFIGLLKLQDKEGMNLLSCLLGNRENLLLKLKTKSRVLQMFSNTIADLQAVFEGISFRFPIMDMLLP